jgi:hypothetical protein
MERHPENHSSLPFTKDLDLIKQKLGTQLLTAPEIILLAAESIARSYSYDEQGYE